MGLKLGGGAALVGVQEMAAIANAAGRGLYEAGEEARPGGRSDLAYMQHKYTPLDSRIIIITAAILLLLLSILFLNFCIRWALCRFFLLRSQKPINPNKGLSKRQVQALPSFIYSSSKPPLPCHLIASAPCAHPKFYPSFLPFTTAFHAFHPTPFCSTKLDGIDYHLPMTKFEAPKGDPSKFEVPKAGDHKPPSQLISNQVDDIDSDPTAKFGSPEVSQVKAGNDSPSEKDEVVNNANSIISSTKTNVHTIHCEVKGNSPTFKGGNHIIDCTKIDEMANHGDDNASSPAPCPICLVDFADGDTIRVLPACGHYFHIGCIDLWLAKSSSCPACRANLLEASRTQSTLQVQVVTTNSL